MGGQLSGTRAEKRFETCFPSSNIPPCSGSSGIRGSRPVLNGKVESDSVENAPRSLTTIFNFSTLVLFHGESRILALG